VAHRRHRQDRPQRHRQENLRLEGIDDPSEPLPELTDAADRRGIDGTRGAEAAESAPGPAGAVGRDAGEPLTMAKSGILLLIHPVTADVVVYHRGEGLLAKALILEGYNPIGPRGLAAAKIIRAGYLNDDGSVRHD